MRMPSRSRGTEIIAFDERRYRVCRPWYPNLPEAGTRPLAHNHSSIVLGLVRGRDKAAERPLRLFELPGQDSNLEKQDQNLL